MMNTHYVRAAIAFSAALTATLVSSATAAPTQGPLIPDGAHGSIAIHKYLQPPLYAPDNYGMELPAEDVADLTPLNGVTFEISQISNVDLNTNVGWQDAQRAADAFDPFDPKNSLQVAGFESNNPLAQTTTNGGTATFANIPVGLYLVEETATLPVAENETVTPAMPFLITVPLTHPTTLHKWIYDLHAYPKNVVSSAEKTVVDSSAFCLGNEIAWNIATSIPGGSVTTKYEVADILDPKTEHQSTTVTIDGNPTNDFLATSKNGIVVTTLGASARQEAFLAQQNSSNAKVTVTHTVVVKASGEITNDATLTFQREGEPETETRSTEAQTKFGGITILKRNLQGTPLPGAIFEIRAAHENIFAKAQALDVNGTTTWSTDSHGKVTVDGLRYSDWADGDTVSDSSNKFNFYWLVELKAPPGYELLSKPIPFVVATQVAQAVTIDVVNTPHNANAELPQTGSEGVKAFILGGLALAGGGIAYLLRRTINKVD